jgi:hypothetical protein
MFGFFSRKKLVEYSDELSAFLKAFDHVKELQSNQREMSDAIRRLGDRVQGIEVEFRALKSEIRAETLKETQATVNAVQGAFYQRLQDIAVDVAVLRRDVRRPTEPPAGRLAVQRADGAAPAG